MIILGGPLLVFCLLVGAILYSRARDQAPRCPACRRVVPAGATRCPHCTSDIAATFTLAEQRAFYRSGAVVDPASAEPRPLASSARPRVRWGVIASIVAAFAVVVALIGLGVVLMDRRADSAAARRSAEETAARQPATPGGAPPPEFSAEVHRLTIDRAEAAAAASAAEQPKITRDGAVTEEPALPATHRPKPVSPPPYRGGLALLAAQQRARYDEEARTRLAAGADVAQPAPVEASPTVTESGHRVVLRDGSAVASKDLPRLTGNAVIFTDMRNRLVSMRASEVDLRATEAANGILLRPQPPP